MLGGGNGKKFLRVPPDFNLEGNVMCNPESGWPVLISGWPVGVAGDNHRVGRLLEP